MNQCCPAVPLCRSLHPDLCINHSRTAMDTCQHILAGRFSSIITKSFPCGIEPKWTRGSLRDHIVDKTVSLRLARAVEAAMVAQHELTSSSPSRCCEDLVARTARLALALKERHGTKQAVAETGRPRGLEAVVVGCASNAAFLLDLLRGVRSWSNITSAVQEPMDGHLWEHRCSKLRQPRRERSRQICSSLL